MLLDSPVADKDILAEACLELYTKPGKNLLNNRRISLKRDAKL